MDNFPPRIHVLLASDAPMGLVIRRGPAKHVATLLWDRRRDEFHLGQWLKGRIYERRSDLSPDGKHFIYFAMNGHWTSEARGAWTAISRATYLKAIAIFPKGDCWHGGGLWTGNATYWLNDGYGHTLLRDTAEVGRDMSFCPRTNYGGECLGVYYHRLVRDGWSLMDRKKIDRWRDRDIFEKSRDVFEKPIGKGWTLCKIAHAESGSTDGKGCYWDEHTLINSRSDTAIVYPDWEWADLDGERLVWASGGKLKTAKVTEDGSADESDLHDFTEMTFVPVEAPY